MKIKLKHKRIGGAFISYYKLVVRGVTYLRELIDNKWFQSSWVDGKCTSPRSQITFTQVRSEETKEMNQATKNAFHRIRKE